MGQGCGSREGLPLAGLGGGVFPQARWSVGPRLGGQKGAGSDAGKYSDAPADFIESFNQ